MDIDLSSMSAAELRKLSKRVDKALLGHEKRRKKEARAAIEKLAKDYGYSVDEVLGGKVASGDTEKPARKSKGKGKAKAKAKAVYANPEDASQTWSGKGRRPNWFLAATQNGVDPDTMKI